VLLHLTFSYLNQLQNLDNFTRGDAFDAREVTDENKKSNLGTVPRRRGSNSVACRSALAKALKVASII
jgi:hypothetical protein